jgi:DnaK suppressor protein
LIKKIKKALERFENGTFGICEVCEEEISIERLKARPVTTQCIECKTREEDMEKALGI